MSYLTDEVVDALQQSLQQFAERCSPVTDQFCLPDFAPQAVLQRHPELSKRPVRSLANWLNNHYPVQGQQIINVGSC